MHGKGQKERKEEKRERDCDFSYYLLFMYNPFIYGKGDVTSIRICMPCVIASSSSRDRV